MVVVFGSINLDLIARVPRIAARGETVSGSSFSTAPGGKGANQALAARRAGAEVAMFGAVGRDAFAAAALANLAASGIDMAGITAVDAATGVALVTVDDHGENSITVIPGANAEARAVNVPDAVLTTTTVLLLQLEVPLSEVEALAQRANRRGARVILNASPASALPEALLACLSLLIVNEHEAQVIGAGWSFPEAAESFLTGVRGYSPADVVVTLGSRGAVMLTAAGLTRVAPPRVAVVDSTGAGDALAGAIASALDHNVAMERALVEGVVAGALNCTRHGAQAAMPDAAAIANAATDVEFTRHSSSIE